MQNSNRKIEQFIDEKLRGSRINRTSDNFTALLMKRAAAEHKSALEESKWDRLVKYIIGSFSLLIIGSTIVLGFISGSSSNVNNPSRGIDISPAVETSNNFLDRFLGLIQSAFVNVLNFLGFTTGSKSITIIFLVVVAALVFLLAERFVLRNRLRSSGVTLK
jgi:hypothetical protein